MLTVGHIHAGAPSPGGTASRGSTSGYAAARRPSTCEHILVAASYVSVQGNVRRLNHRFPLFELELDEGRGVGRRAAARLDRLSGD
jgi:hypothetical protein